jgi:hypothetical protein
MSGNVHGHQMPPKGINVNPDNPVFGRDQPDPVIAEIPQGLHGAPALRSEFDESPVPLQPVADNVDKVRTEDSSLQPDPVRVPTAPETARNSAIDAADENAHNAAVAAEVAEKAADDAAANAAVVHSE